MSSLNGKQKLELEKIHGINARSNRELMYANKAAVSVERLERKRRQTMFDPTRVESCFYLAVNYFKSQVSHWKRIQNGLKLNRWE